MALILLSSAAVCSDSPSISVEVSLPPISAGAITKTMRSTSPSLTKVAFKLPPDCHGHVCSSKVVLESVEQVGEVNPLVVEHVKVV